MMAGAVAVEKSDLALDAMKYEDVVETHVGTADWLDEEPDWVSCRADEAATGRDLSMASSQTSTLETSSALAGLKKFYEGISSKYIADSSTVSPSSSLCASSNEDSLRYRKTLDWCEMENENLERSLEHIGSDKNLKKWLRGSKKLLHDLSDPRRQENWPPIEELERAQHAASLATEAVNEGKAKLVQTRSVTLSITDRDTSVFTSSTGRNSGVLNNLGELRLSELGRYSTKTLSSRNPPKSGKVRSSKKPQFSIADEVIPDAIIMENISPSENCEEVQSVVAPSHLDIKDGLATLRRSSSADNSR
mmetsp:Transcript_10932/g.33518  ORF Transcript_10932/g.33518 Transcript_10932/m.33518 type:complete len:306 (+) Transcript_10932:155-1072(+)